MSRLFLTWALSLSALSMQGAGRPEVASPLDLPMTTSVADLEKRLGGPDHTLQGPSYLILEYNLGPADTDDLAYAWAFYFERPSGRLLMIAHNQVSAPMGSLLPDGTSRTAVSPGPNSLSVRYRQLPGDRVLLGIGISSARDVCSQAVMIRSSAVARFYPWLAAQLH